MGLLIETIRVEDGQLFNMEYHQQRANASAQQLWNGKAPDLLNALNETSIPLKGVFKCRIIYGKKIGRIDFQPYTARPIQALKLVESNSINYALKYADRPAIDALFAQKGCADDILIIKNGLVTDTSYCNVLFEKNGKWATPDTPLLPGTMRASLLAKGIIIEERIKAADIHRFSRLKLINAMLPFDKGIEIPTAKIYPADERN